MLVLKSILKKRARKNSELQMTHIQQTFSQAPRAEDLMPLKGMSYASESGAKVDGVLANNS